MSNMILVLLPGMDGTGDLFDAFVQALGKRVVVQVVRYPVDQPLGYGQLQAFVRERLPSHARFVLLGESFSGPVAIALAASNPANLKGLVLCCSFAKTPHRLLRVFRPLLGLVSPANLPWSWISIAMLGPFASTTLQVPLSRAIASVTRATMQARMFAVSKVDASADLAQLRVPTLYLQASRDRLVPSSVARTIAQLQPGTRVISFDAPHLLLQVVPVQAADAVVDFVHQIEACG